MIVEDQKNLKVHFAGGEQTDFAYCITKGAGIRYILFSCFGYISSSLNIKNGGWWQGIPVYKELEYFKVRHSIMDSGLYTLIFGAHAGKRTEKEIEVWYRALIELVLKEEIVSACVEVDCQKILGPEKAWELRRRMRNDLPNNRIINVFHKEDGQKGLDELIEFTDYIAISVPELKGMGQGKYVQVLADYIKNKKPGIDIHLLGCTDQKLLKKLKYCTTSDSTSWIQLNRYGSIGHKVYKKDISTNKVVKEFGDTLKGLSNRYKLNKKESYYHYLGAYIVAAKYYKSLYTKIAGSQE